MNKICALFRQTWYETAVRNLSPEDRLRFYEICFEYEFYGNLPTPDAPFTAKLMFDMVKNDLDSDKAKAERRAQASRENGQKGGRPKETEENKTEQNPVGFVGFDRFAYTLHNDTTINTTQQNTTESEESENTHTFFSVCLLFFERGTSSPVQEAEKFWNYYAAMGWKTKGGGEIVDKYALAKAWRLPDCSKHLMIRRQGYADFMRKLDPVEPVLLEEFVALKRDEERKSVQISFLTKTPAILLDTKYQKKGSSICKEWLPKDSDGNLYELQFAIKSPEIEYDQA